MMLQQSNSAKDAARTTGTIKRIFARRPFCAIQECVTQQSGKTFVALFQKETIL
jgi:hypothetical protein